VAGYQKVTVSWTAPANPGTGISRYTVTANPGGAGCVTADADTTSCVVTGLTEGTAYTFTVVANGIGTSGDSAPSAPSAAVTPVGAPGVPTGVTVVAGDHQITVSWTAPAQVGPGIVRYIATAR
jgi:titin